MIEHRDARYYEHANAHIELANQQVREAIPPQVVASMINATARFSAFAWATSSQSGEEYETYRQKALDGFLADCRRQFEDHFNDHARNFDKLMGRQPNNAG